MLGEGVEQETCRTSVSESSAATSMPTIGGLQKPETTVDRWTSCATPLHKNIRAKRRSAPARRPPLAFVHLICDRFEFLCQVEHSSGNVSSGKVVRRRKRPGSRADTPERRWVANGAVRRLQHTASLVHEASTPFGKAPQPSGSAGKLHLTAMIKGAINSEAIKVAP